MLQTLNSDMAPVISLPFCIACMVTEELFNIHEPFRDSSSETFSNLLKKCFDFEVESDSLQYLCIKCSYRLIDAQNFKDELQSTIEVLLDATDAKNIEFDSEIGKEDVSSEDDSFDKNDLKPLKELIVVAANKKSKTICSICKSDFKNTKKLRRHIRQTHPDRYKCDKCDKSFIWQGSLNRHQRNHDPRIIQKKQEIASERQKSAAEKPKKKKVQYKEPLPFTLEPNQTVCKMCDAEFTLPRMLHIHMHEHYPLHVCEECGKGYATKASLRRHKVAHVTGPFTCQHCGKVFDHLNTLLGHLRLRHSGTSLLFPCDKCEVRFATAVQRIDHKATVHGEKTKLYQCAQCDRVFKRYVHMLTHLQSRHVPDSKRTCAFCSKQFAEVKNLGRHIRKIHKLPFSYKKHSYYNTVGDNINNSIEFDE